ncbi:MAG TPA: glycine betaine ABC transporter substrate-binding protein, partial [Thermoanaerobaculia bacterium]|nr:glycine betaine ABC transporter substrate-binding protein [Thermoanaerobaculia bacterium]
MDRAAFRTAVAAGLSVALAATGATAGLAGCSRPPTLVVGSKNFTEQEILGEIAAQQLERRLGARVTRTLDIGGTLLAHEIAGLTGEHIVLVAVALATASLIGIPTGIFLTRNEAWRGAVLGFTNVVQTIPSLALFGFLIPLPFIGGIGKRT